MFDPFHSKHLMEKYEMRFQLCHMTCGCTRMQNDQIRMFASLCWQLALNRAFGKRMHYKCSIWKRIFQSGKVGDFHVCTENYFGANFLKSWPFLKKNKFHFFFQWWRNWFHRRIHRSITLGYCSWSKTSGLCTDSF